MERGWGQAGNGHAVRPSERGEEVGTGWQSLVFLGKPVIQVEPRYPGTAHCFFAQEPVEARGGNVSGTMQGHPDSTGLVGTLFL